MSNFAAHMCARVCYRRRLRPPAGTLALSGACASVIYVAPNKTPSARVVDHDLTFWLWGLVGHEHVPVDQDCGAAGAAKIRARNTFVDGLLGGITLGIYQPRTVTVTCAQ